MRCTRAFPGVDMSGRARLTLRNARMQDRVPCMHACIYMRLHIPVYILKSICICIIYARASPWPPLASPWPPPGIYYTPARAAASIVHAQIIIIYIIHVYVYMIIYIYVYINSIHKNIGITNINLSLYVYMLIIYSHMYLRYI